MAYAPFILQFSIWKTATICAINHVVIHISYNETINIVRSYENNTNVAVANTPSFI